MFSHILIPLLKSKADVCNLKNWQKGKLNYSIDSTDVFNFL